MKYHERKNTNGQILICINRTVGYSNEPLEETQQEPSGRFGGGEKNAGAMERGAFLEINHEWVERMLDRVIERE